MVARSSSAPGPVDGGGPERRRGHVPGPRALLPGPAARARSAGRDARRAQAETVLDESSLKAGANDLKSYSMHNI